MPNATDKTRVSRSTAFIVRHLGEGLRKVYEFLVTEHEHWDIEQVMNRHEYPKGEEIYPYHCRTYMARGQAIIRNPKGKGPDITIEIQALIEMVEWTALPSPGANCDSFTVWVKQEGERKLDCRSFWADEDGPIEREEFDYGKINLLPGRLKRWLAERIEFRPHF